MLVLTVALAATGAAWWYADQRTGRRDIAELAARLEMEQTRREALDREIAETAGRLAAYRQDVRALLEVRRDELNRIERTVQALEMERNASERIIRDYASGVPLIQGVVAYEDGAGRPLRYLGVDPKGRPPRDPFGWPRMSADGQGPVVRTTFLGTGFLVSRDGAILTSRHVARPWDVDPALADLLEQEGVRPRVVQLRAFFPGVPDPVPLTVVKASANRDLIVLRGQPLRSAPVLPLDLEGADAVPGRPVIVLGYPAGLQLLLARVAPDLLETLIGRDVTEITDESVDVPALVEKLSRLNQIRPYPTWGRLADKRPHQLAHDAGTSMGGSGGPIFATSGRVIGLSTAVARDFDGAALGVPIREAMGPLAHARRIASPARAR
jgi:S1-C subfamily serine protease